MFFLLSLMFLALLLGAGKESKACRFLGMQGLAISMTATGITRGSLLVTVIGSCLLIATAIIFFPFYPKGKS